MVASISYVIFSFKKINLVLQKILILTITSVVPKGYAPYTLKKFQDNLGYT